MKIKRNFKDIKRDIPRIGSLIIGAIRRNKVSVYWWDEEKNFGDLITPLLFKVYGFTPVHYYPAYSEVVSTGSILHLVPEEFSGYIAGSGLMNDTVRSFCKAKILGVRGELTRQRIDAPKNVVLGDPGLLVSKLLKQRQRKRYVLGIVPHYKDRPDTRIAKIYRKYKPDVLIIDVMRHPLKAITDIDKCEYILSSSLHGIVVADSLGIPNAWVWLSDEVGGNGFKFFDYFSAFGTRHAPVHLSGNETLASLLRTVSIPPEQIEEIKEKLHNMFLFLRDEILFQ